MAAPAAPALAMAGMLAAMVIYGANFGVSRLGTLAGMTPADLVVLRFAVAGPLLMPVFLLRGGFRTCAGLGWRKGIALGVMGGAPMALLMNTGLSYAPAAHGAALGPGTVTVVGVVYGIATARSAPTVPTLLGLGGILLGLLCIMLAGSIAPTGPATLVGDGLFVLTGLLWGFYPVLVHRWRVEPITGAAVVAVLSLAYLVHYGLAERSQLMAVPGWFLAGQALYQGGLNIIVGLWLWGFAVKVLGAARTQLFPPLIPVLGTLLAIPIVGEWPGTYQIAGLVLIVSGICLALLGQRRTPRPAPDGDAP